MDWVRTDINGVPTFWCDYDGELRAGLVFRVGQVDEPLAKRGITHLIEHLALHPLGQPAHGINGEVDAITTTFATHGSPDEVREFVATVCRALTDLPVDRREAEVQILRTEADGRGDSVSTAIDVCRYGAASYGLPGYPEFGVGQHSADELRDWSRRWFTRGNAALWLIGGPPPDGLRIDLPDGPRMPPPAPTDALPRTPATFPAPVNGVGWGGVVERSTAAKVYSELLGRRLHRELRIDSGLSYSPSAAYTPRDAEHAHIVAFADALPAAYDELVPAFTRVLDRLAVEPPSTDELADAIAPINAAIREPGAASGFTVTAAMSELLGMSPLRLADYEAELTAVTPDAVHAAARQAHDTAVLMTPPGHAPPEDRYAPVPLGSPGTVDGTVLTSWRSATSSEQRTIGPDQDGHLRLVIGPRGISEVEGPVFTTIPFADCGAMLAWPDGARRLYGTDGLVLHVEPNMWRGGGILPERIDNGVDPDVVIPLPPREPQEIPRPTVSAVERIVARLKRR
ncbi:M16 family metallopeptidase [Haloechinothrix halophila]|uniref:M16 family metallopeptidase n=1 Tax=Haloechinothrix halophila TaxID=1069073 RepID=UPI00041E2244|nr:insulinase family protein [Haloechinothrix halophila]